jgi:hypothetical protein
MLISLWDTIDAVDPVDPVDTVDTVDAEMPKQYHQPPECIRRLRVSSPYKLINL